MNVHLIYETLWSDAGSSLVDFNAGKNKLVSIHWCNNVAAVNVKMDRSAIEKT